MSHGMLETQLPGVQHLAPGQPLQTGVVRAAINRIADDGVADRCQVNADLVRATGVEAAFQQRSSGETAADLPIRARRPPRRQHRHFPALNRVASDGAINAAARSARRSPDQGEIDFFNGSRLKRSGQVTVGGVGFRDHKAAAGLLVQTMNDPGAFNPADAAQLVATMMQKGMHQRMGGLARARMHQHSGGFVQNQQMFVLEQNLERNVLGFERRRRRRREFDFDPVPRADGRADGAKLTAQPDAFPGDEPLEHRAGMFGELLVKPEIQPTAGRGGLQNL